MEQKQELTDELDRQLRVREKHDLMLSANSQAVSSYKLGMTQRHSGFSLVTSYSSSFFRSWEIILAYHLS